MKTENNIEKIAIDALLEKPITFKLDGHFFYVYPPSIGVSMLSKQILERLEINKYLVTINPTISIINVVREHKNDILRLIAIHTFKDRINAMDEKCVSDRMEELGNIGLDNMTVVLIGILEWENWRDKIEKHYHLDKEREKRNEVNKVKENDKSSITFGGLSIWGTMIDFACERYGWSVDYTVWGVSSLNLSLMMSDSINSVYLTDDERKKCHISTDKVYINADDRANLQQLRSIING